MIRPLALSLLAATLLAAPAAAQDTGGDKIRMVIVYGDDEPPASTDPDEIVVVAHMPENDRYRIPQELRFSDDPANMAWARRVERLDMIGKFGTNSCSPAGAGGFTGCTQLLIDQAYADKRDNSDNRFSTLIAAARAERLSTVDADAAEQQARVEVLEKQYMDKLEKEREALTPGENTAPAPGDAPPIMTKPK